MVEINVPIFLPDISPFNNTFFHCRYTLSVEVVPICKDNVVCLPDKLAHSLGGIGQICVVYKVTSKLHLIDPNTCQCKVQVILIERNIASDPGQNKKIISLRAQA